MTVREAERQEDLVAQRWISLIGKALLSAVALALAGVSAVLIRKLLPDHLHATTDIVGYPTHSGFNVNRYFYNYYLVALYLPFATGIAYLALTRTLVRSASRLLTIEVPSPEMKPGSNPEQAQLLRTGRTALVGLVLALEGVSVFGRTGTGSLAAVIGTLAVYVIVVKAVTVSSVARILGSEPRVRESAVNTLGLALAFPGFWVMSRSTLVHVQSSGLDHRYPWLALWVALLACGVFLFSILRGLRSAKGGPGVFAVERRALLAVAGPMCLFLFFSQMPGAIGVVEAYHDGEALVPQELIRHGLFPWRDFFFIHGVLYDILRAGIGTHLFDNSMWGGLAGEFRFVVPLYWITLYALAVRLFRDNRAGLWLAGVLGITVAAPYMHYRFLLLPIVFLAFIRLLELGTWWRALSFTFVLTVQVLLSPEAAFSLFACGFPLLAFEISNAAPGLPLRRRFSRTARCVTVGTGLTAVWFAYLALNSSAGAFIESTLVFARGHRLTGGLPVYWGGLAFLIATVLPVAAVQISIWILARQWLRQRSLSVENTLLLAASIFDAIYYTKFLSRADDHVFQSMAAAYPLFLILGSRGLRNGEAVVSRMGWWPDSWRSISRPFTLITLGLVLVTQADPVLNRVRLLPTHLAVAVPAEPVVPRVGYSGPGAVDAAMVSDMGKVLGAYLSPGDALFDFTNGPLIFHYLLPYVPSTRYFHVSLAIRQGTQRDLIAKLRAAPPRLVIFDGIGFGLPAWDGVPNVVRHYEVSQYLLDNYRPLLRLHGYVLMVPRSVDSAALPPLPHDLVEQPSFDDIAYGVQPCNWGYASNYLRPYSGSGAQGILLELRPTGPLSVRISLPLGQRWSVFRALEIRSADGFRRGAFAISPPGSGQPATHAIVFNSLKKTERSMQIRVGSCPAWHAYDADALELRFSVPQRILEARLLPG